MASERVSAGRPFVFLKNGSFILIYNQIGYPAVTIQGITASDRLLPGLNLICGPYMFLHQMSRCIRSGRMFKTLVFTTRLQLASSQIDYISETNYNHS